MPAKEDTTHGIEIKYHALTCLKENVTKKIQANIWDFGGQEIYHTTHQFFLTDRSLYVLVSDNRKEDTDFAYWLYTIGLLSGNSPVLIVQNEKDNRTKQLDYVSLKESFPNLIDSYFNVNFATNQGLKGMQEAIEYQLSHLPHIGDKLPKKWVALRRKLEEDNRDYISYTEYLVVAKGLGIEEEQLKRISQYLHDLGTVLHFQDLELYQLVILNPEWGTNAVYKALDAPKIVAQEGKFTVDDLSAIWLENDYPKDKHLELLSLMMCFNLCYKIENTQIYIAPQLLNIQKPKFKFPKEKIFQFQYHYSFMPKGIITRFIVKMHRKIKENLVWQNGVVLQLENTQSLITEHLFERKMKIQLSGVNSKEFLFFIRDTLKSIHDTFTRLEYKELLPCNCVECLKSTIPHLYDLERLNNAKAKGVKNLQCQSSWADVPIIGLLDAINPSNANMEQIRNKVVQERIDFDAINPSNAIIEQVRNKIVEERINEGIDLLLKQVQETEDRNEILLYRTKVQ